MTIQTRLVASPDVLFQEVSGEAVLLDIKSEYYFGLNSIGTRIWQLLAANGHRDAVLMALQDEFEVDLGQLERDVDALIEDLLAAGLIRHESLDVATP
jgi:hypothetical protein